MPNELVIVAMSGGVDSSLACALLHEQGYGVIGVTMRLWEYAADADHRRRTMEPMEDARAVCQRFGVPHYNLDLRQTFERSVIEDFVNEYEAGRTPNPCVRCNVRIKWNVLLAKARMLGASAVATGHYARLMELPDGTVELRKGVDRRKDQSYALWGLVQETLRMTKLPLGDLRKEQTRKMAAERGLKTAEKPESQDICFVPDDDYARFLADWTGRKGRVSHALEPGAIRDSRGEVVGTHRGVAHYTIGQRKGLGVALGRPRYVTRIDPGSKTIWIGDPDDLLADELVASDVNWTLGRPPLPEQNLQAKIRYSHEGSAARVTSALGATMTVRFERPQRAITPGQSVVIYDGDLVLGGGVIASARQVNPGRSARDTDDDGPSGNT